MPHHYYGQYYITVSCETNWPEDIFSHSWVMQQATRVHFNISTVPSAAFTPQVHTDLNRGRRSLIKVSLLKRAQLKWKYLFLNHLWLNKSETFFFPKTSVSFQEKGNLHLSQTLPVSQNRPVTEMKQIEPTCYTHGYTQQLFSFGPRSDTLCPGGPGAPGLPSRPGRPSKPDTPLSPWWHKDRELEY